MLVVLGVVVVLVILVAVVYNGLVTARQNVKNAWSQIDVQLQRRFDLIPNLIETVKGYMTHERETLSKVTAMRSSWNAAETVDEKAAVDSQVTGALRTIMATAESYPDLKASVNFRELQEELRGTENKIAYARQFYNDSATRYNTKLETFPTNLLANMFHFTPESLYKVDDETVRQNVKVKF